MSEFACGRMSVNLHASVFFSIPNKGNTKQKQETAKGLNPPNHLDYPKQFIFLP